MAKLRLGKNQLSLLLEALRRYTRFNNQNKSITEAWTGLGSASCYAPAVNGGYMQVATSPNPGYITWWKLTEKGAMIVNAMLKEGYDYRHIEGLNLSTEKGKKVFHSISPASFFPETGNSAIFDTKKQKFL